MTSKQRILSVVAPHSGSGKTTFVLHLLQHTSGVGTLKISPAIDWPDADSPAGTFVGQDFYLEDPAQLNRKGKDTARYFQTGAVRVERLRHRRGGLAAGLEAALKRYPPGAPVVVESSSAASLLEPVGVVLVVRAPLREMKPATEAILPRVTDLLVNASDQQGLATAARRALLHDYSALDPQYTWTADLAGEPPPAAMLERLRMLLEVFPHEPDGG